MLGTNVTYNLKWDVHIINEIISKASKRLHTMRVLNRYGANKEDLKLVYISLVRSCLEYSSVVWQGGLSDKLRAALESVQKRALRIIYPFHSYSQALNILSIDTLDERRQHICKKFASSFISIY